LRGAGCPWNRVELCTNWPTCLALRAGAQATILALRLNPGAVLHDFQVIVVAGAAVAAAVTIVVKVM